MDCIGELVVVVLAALVTADTAALVTADTAALVRADTSGVLDGLSSLYSHQQRRFVLDHLNWHWEA